MTDTFTAQKSLYAEYSNLANMVLIYGAASSQAAAAQTDLNNQMLILGNTAGVAAELGLAKSVDALNRYWDQATSGARIAAVGILSQGVTLANEYIPLVAAAAQRNFGIISDGLKPLFAWLEGPDGIGIFQNLETIFASNLPYAVDAFDQAIEFLLKSINYLAPATGGVVKMLDDLFTKANSPSGFFRWEGIMNSLIADFHAWQDLIKTLGRDIYDLFSRSQGTAMSIVLQLDDMLKRLGDWERSTQGQHSIDTIFAVHKQEIDQLLQVLPPVLEGMGKIYLTAAPALTAALTKVVGAIVPVLDAMVKTPFGAYALGLELVALKLGKVGAAAVLLAPELGGILTVLAPLMGAVAQNAFGGAILGVTILAAQFGLLGRVLSPLGGLITANLIAPVGRALGMWLIGEAVIIGTFIQTEAQAIVFAARVSGAWVASAVASSGAWLVAKAQMIGAFIATVASSVAQAIAASSAWVAHAAVAATAWVVSFVSRMAGAGAAVAVTAGAEAAATSGAWATAATGASGAWATAYAAIIAGAGTAVAAVSAIIATIVVAIQGIHNLINDFHNSPLGQGTGSNPLPPPSSWRNDIPGALGHAFGGVIPPGTWGIINEIGPEPVFASTSGALVVPNSQVTPLMSFGGPAYRGGSAGGTTTNVTITSNPVFNITGLPQQVVDQVRAIVQENNQQLVAAMGA